MNFTFEDFKNLYEKTHNKQFDFNDYNTSSLIIKEGKFDNGDHTGNMLIKKLLVAYIPNLPKEKQLHFMLLEHNDINHSSSNYQEVLDIYNALQ